MTTASFDVVRPRRSLAALVAAALRRMAERVAEHMERRRAMRVLMALDDRGLKDIGLHRSGIFHAVHQGRDEPPVTATAAPVRPAPPPGWR